MTSVSISSFPSRVWRYKFRHRTLLLVALLLATWKNQSLSPSLADAWVSPRWNRHLSPPTVTPKLESTEVVCGCGARQSVWCCVVGVDTSPLRRISTALGAKNTRKGKKRSGGPRGGGRRGKAKTKNTSLEDEEESSGRKEIRDPKRLRKRLIDLPRRLPPNDSEQQQQQPQQQQQQYLPPLKVCSVEVDDKEWWEQEGNENPYGARLWPSALAISEFLVDLGMMQHTTTTNSTAPTTENRRCGLQGYELLELGCGAGLVSIVAAECGASVVATDISPLALKLCRTGWKETQKLKQAQQTALQQKREQKLKLQQKFRQLRTDGAGGASPAAAANKPLPVRKDENPC